MENLNKESSVMSLNKTPSVIGANQEIMEQIEACKITPQQKRGMMNGSYWDMAGLNEIPDTSGQITDILECLRS